MLARAQHRQGRRRVQMVGRRDRDRIDAARRDLVEARRPRAPESLGERARAAFVTVADDQDFAAGMRGKRERMVRPPQARTDDADLDRLVSHAWESLARFRRGWSAFVLTHYGTSRRLRRAMAPCRDRRRRHLPACDTEPNAPRMDG